MAQLTGSGPGYGTNYVMVDSSVGINNGRLFVDSLINGVGVIDSALTVISLPYQRLLDSQSFLCGSVFYKSVDGGSPSILLNIGSVNLHVDADFKTDGDATMIVIENVSVTNSGTQNVIINRDRDSTNTINSTIWTDPTYTAGSVIHTAMFLGGSGTTIKFQSAPVGTGIAGEEVILTAGSSYVYRFDNIAARPVSYDWNLDIHEHH